MEISLTKMGAVSTAIKSKVMKMPEKVGAWRTQRGWPMTYYTLDRLLQTFKIETLADTPASDVVKQAQRLLNAWAKGALR